MIEKPTPPYQCIEEAVDPERYKQPDRESRRHNNKSCWKIAQSMEINPDGEFPCLNPECGRRTSVGYSHGYETGAPSGQIITGWRYDITVDDDAPSEFADCPMCDGAGHLAWARFQHEYNRIMKRYRAKLKKHEKKIAAARSLCKDLTRDEVYLIQNYDV